VKRDTNSSDGLDEYETWLRKDVWFFRPLRDYEHNVMGVSTVGNGGLFSDRPWRDYRIGFENAAPIRTQGNVNDGRKVRWVAVQ